MMSSMLLMNSQTAPGVRINTTGVSGNSAPVLGYDSSLSLGTITDPNTTDGRVVDAIVWNATTEEITLRVSGFSSDPGSGWMTNIFVDGSSGGGQAWAHLASAATYIFVGGNTGVWTWYVPGAAQPFTFLPSGGYTLLIS